MSKVEYRLYESGLSWALWEHKPNNKNGMLRLIQNDKGMSWSDFSYQYDNNGYRTVIQNTKVLSGEELNGWKAKLL